jgi:hypothetical protein
MQAFAGNKNTAYKKPTTMGTTQFPNSLIAEDKELELAKKLRAVDCFYWLDKEGISLGGKPYLIEGHEYQIDWLQCEAPRQCYMKGAQMGATEIAILLTLHGMMYGRYPQGALYLFPTAGDVTDFSKGRFAPLINDNPQISVHVRDTDAANIKRVGKGFLYFRGARSSHKIEGAKSTSSKLKSVPVDRIVFDEKDEMEPDMVTLALERLSHSTVQEVISVSTPSIPDYGIDKDYQASDQRIQIIKCRHCGTDNCLELDFPDCLIELQDGTVKRVCRKCKNEIHPRQGQWVAQYPSLSEKLVGWWISQLHSVFINPKTILDMYKNPPNGNLAEVYNSKLGMAYIAAENRLTKNDIYECCGNEAMAVESQITCAMGVDVGKELHVVIGMPNKVLKVARVADFKDVHDLAKRFNVKIAVFDAEPETRKVRDYRDAADYAVYLCDYQERLKAGMMVDQETGALTVRRTETCDASHTLITSGLLTLPRRNPEIDQFATECSNIAKVLEEDELGNKKYTYRKLGPDHYRHATNYFMLACNEDRGVLGVDTDPVRRMINQREDEHTAPDWKPGDFGRRSN